MKKGSNIVSNIMCVAILSVSFTISAMIYSNSDSTDNVVIHDEVVNDDLELTLIDTSDNEYSLLNAECSKYISETNSDEEKQAASARMNMSDVYVDFMPILDDTSSKEASDEKVETGPIYLQDKLLMRYITPDYKVSSVMASIEYPEDGNDINSLGELDYKRVYIKNHSEPEVTVRKQSEISELYKKSDTAENDLNGILFPVNVNEVDGDTENSIELVTINEYSNNFKNKILEEKFIGDIGDIFVDIINGDKSDKNLSEFFTSDGYTITKQSIPLIGESPEIEYIDIGSSNESLVKDRLIIGLDTKKNNSIVNWLVVVKLTEDYKIYDIDIV